MYILAIDLSPKAWNRIVLKTVKNSVDKILGYHELNKILQFSK